jgi:signal transduction histidine kinase
LCLKELNGADGKDAFSGEVLSIWQQTNGNIQFSVSDNFTYRISGGKIARLKHTKKNTEETSAVQGDFIVNCVEQITDRIEAVATDANGVLFRNSSGKVLFKLDDENGLCSDNVNQLAYDGHGHLWGATDNGLFEVALPSVFSRFRDTEGLLGDVISMIELNGNMFVGTLNGLFFRKGNEKMFRKVEGINHACWQLILYKGGILAASSRGTFQVSSDGTANMVTSYGALSVLPVEDGFYSGEMDGIYKNNDDGSRLKVNDIQKATKMLLGKNGRMYVLNLYGQVWQQNEKGSFSLFKGERNENLYALFMYKGNVTSISDSGIMQSLETSEVYDIIDRKGKKKSIDYPAFSFTESDGLLWLTDEKSKKLYAVKDGKVETENTKIVSPMDFLSVMAFMRSGDMIWLGGEFGLVCINRRFNSPMEKMEPKLRIRSVRINNDSVVWGGYGEMPSSLPRFENDTRSVRFSFAVEYEVIFAPTYYRYRMNNGSWSAWGTSTSAVYPELRFGMYKFEVQAKDAYGRLSDVVELSFSIRNPILLRWYMLLLYLILFSYLVYVVFKWRTNQLKKRNMELEQKVEERTSQLHKAQKELVRQEKMATVGKLTQGLIDRIFNPLNFINNFSKMSSGLMNDIEANVDDEKDNMNPDNYEDTKEVIGMVKQNLQKVEEHGLSTTRTLKAMESLIKDSLGEMVDMNLAKMIRDNYASLLKFYEQDIHKYNISTNLECPEEEVIIVGNEDQLSKTVMSLLMNAVYAVKKKMDKNVQSDYKPAVDLSLACKGRVAEITVRDNGIGIEKTIIDKIFDPFFTTKTTAEATGVGLYLSREIAQNHKGDIVVTSEKNVFSEFVITIPLK